MWILVQRRLRLIGPLRVLSESRSWTAMVCAFYDQDSLLIFGFHPDPSLSQLGKGMELAVVTTLFRKLFIRTVAAEDCNTLRTRARLIAWMLEHKTLSVFRIPYLAGTPTNHTVEYGRHRATWIDYVLVESRLFIH